MTEFEKEALALLERIAKAVEGGAPRRDSSAPRPTNSGDAPTNLPNYGRAKGEPIASASDSDLDFYANGARRSLNDPAKSRWHDRERALLAAIEAEIARRQGDGQGDDPSFGEPPGGGGGSADPDIPFMPRWDVA